uniref:E3 ubiquitin-protein ligase TRIM71 n=1 Tax=Phallusia mammillata TaxID=59560 RepID=A0A6F9DW95_9ASCI|nr:E3 ubiquitin-protein ligase TRIM71 [Phallusia mammillata]
MNGRRSPLPSKRRSPNLQSPRPYSMFVGSQYLKVNPADSLSNSSNSSGSPFGEQTSPTRTSTFGKGSKPRSRSLLETLIQPLKSPTFLGKQSLPEWYDTEMEQWSKRNSSVDTSLNCGGAFDSLVCSIHSVDVNANNTISEYVNSPPYTNSSHKKKSNSPQKRMVPPAGPSVKTWLMPKSVKKLPTGGLVFGTHLGKSGLCYVSVITAKEERIIQTYDRNGVLVKSFHTRTTKAGKPFEPYQMCETPEGNIVIACGSCVTVWSKEGKLLNEHGRNMFKFAKSVAVRSTGEIIVTDTDNNAVKIISPNGQQISKLTGDFDCPVGVTVDSDDNIIVVDWKDRISIFDEENELVRSFGTKGGGDGELDLPYGISVDCENNLVIADMWNNRVSVYDREGNFLRHIVPDPEHAIRLPCSVSVSRHDNTEDYRLSVTNFGGTAVYVFTY